MSERRAIIELAGTLILVALTALFVWQGVAIVAAACALAAGYEIGLHQATPSGRSGGSDV